MLVPEHSVPGEYGPLTLQEQLDVDSIRSLGSSLAEQSSGMVNPYATATDIEIRDDLRRGSEIFSILDPMYKGNK